jgi:ABC-2 type transport system ATP-binding protein
MVHALDVRDVEKSYNGHRACAGISLEVPDGAIFGLLGPNGAGKTTLIRMLTGITAPDRGEIRFFGEPFERRHVAQVGYLPEERGLYRGMRVGEQALYLARLSGLERGEAERRLRAWFDRLGVDGWWNRQVADLSKGMAQKVQFIAAVIHRPRVLILDEPLSGFDPVNAARIREAILELRRDHGTTVLLSTHDMGSVEELCDAVALVHQGEVVLQGEVRSLRAAAGGGRYRVGFTAPVIGFTAALGTTAELLAVGPDRDREGGHVAVVRLADGVDVPVWLADRAVEIGLTAWTPYRPGMREMFLEAVGEQVDLLAPSTLETD